MTPEEAQLVQMASAFAAVDLAGDSEGVGILLENLDSEPRLADAFFLIAIMAAETWELATGKPRDRAFDRLRSPRADYPAVYVNRDAAVALTRAVRDNDRQKINAAASQFDTGRAFLSGYDLAQATVELLADATGVPPNQWYTKWAGGAAAGVGVEAE